jgi:hypothetical protein
LVRKKYASDGEKYHNTSRNGLAGTEDHKGDGKNELKEGRMRSMEKFLLVQRAYNGQKPVFYESVL